MKICFYLPNITKGGGSRSQLMLANYLKKYYYVDILTHRNDEIIDNNYKYAGYAFNNKIFSFIVNSFFAAYSMRKYDLVVTSLITNIFVLRIFISKRKIIHFARHYDRLLIDKTKLNNRFLLFIYRFFSDVGYKLISCFFVNSNWTKNQIIKINRRAKYFIIQNGVDENVFNKNNQIKPSKRRIIGVIGKTQKWKGLNESIKAVEILRYKIKDLKLVIITSDDRVGEYSESWIDVVRPKNDIELVKLYNSLDIFISASWYEGFCNPPLEAMACGIPSVITDSGGVNEYAKDDFNCIMVNVNDIQGLSNGIERIISNDEIFLKFVKNGLNTADNFKWIKSLEKFKQYIEEVF